jgi:hypothetical protein
VTTPKKAPKVPAAVTRVLGQFDHWDAAELRTYVQGQRAAYDSIDRRGVVDYPGFLAFKLSCSRKDAEAIDKWAATTA